MTDTELIWRLATSILALNETISDNVEVQECITILKEKDVIIECEDCDALFVVDVDNNVVCDGCYNKMMSKLNMEDPAIGRADYMHDQMKDNA